MSNPYFDRSAAFNESGRGLGGQRTPNGYPTMPGYQPAGTATAQAPYGQQAQYGQQYPQYGQQAAQPQYGQYSQASQYGQTAYPGGYGTESPDQMSRLEQQYAAPAAANVDLGRMTYDDVIVRTGTLLAVIVAAGALTWILSTAAATAAIGMLLTLVGCLGGLVLGFVNAFKREPSPALIVSYALLEGMMLGGVSGITDAAYPGVVIESVIATVITFGIVLVAYSKAGFRVRGKAARILLVAMGAYMVFALVNLGLQLTGVAGGEWGLYSVKVGGFPLGLIVGALAIVMAAASLAMDFESIQRGVERGLPKKWAWAGAYGLTVTLVWLYVEFLRILSILRDN